MPDILTYGKPEEEGIRSEWIIDILDDLKERGYVAHSVLIARHGKVVAEGYYAPFKRDDFHRMYSTSKSFVSTAIGMLIGEGKIALDDKIVKFFPDKVKEPVHPWVANMTVRDLLRMATPFARPTYSFDRKDWVDSYFYTKPVHPGGTYFAYDTSGTYILDVIVERITGKPFMDYLYDVLLREAGCSEGMWCIKAPDGYTWGGSGVQCTTRDIARLGQIYLNRGVVNGKQILPRDFAIEAVRRQIDNCPTGNPELVNGQGYGYQIWCCKNGTFAFRGMGGQTVIADPDTGLMIASTADVQGNTLGYNTIAEHFFQLRKKIIKSGATSFPADSANQALLSARLSELVCNSSIYTRPGEEWENKLFGQTFELEANPMGIERIRFETKDGKGKFIYYARGEEKTIDFGIGHYEIGTFPETKYDGITMGEPIGRGYRTMCEGGWNDPGKFVLRVYLIDLYFGNFTATFDYKDDTVSIMMSKTAEHFLNEYNGTAVGYCNK